MAQTVFWALRSVRDNSHKYEGCSGRVRQAQRYRIEGRICGRITGAGFLFRLHSEGRGFSVMPLLVNLLCGGMFRLLSITSAPLRTLCTEGQSAEEGWSGGPVVCQRRTKPPAYQKRAKLFGALSQRTHVPNAHHRNPHTPALRLVPKALQAAGTPKTRVPGLSVPWKTQKSQ